MKRWQTIRTAAARAALLAALACVLPPGAYAAESGGYVPGARYAGTQGYIEYQAGNLPIILSAPHGGSLQPAGIPDRRNAVTLNDHLSQAFVWDLAAALFEQTGRYPHVVVNELHRAKLDPNRDLTAGAQGAPAAVRAWHEYHGFLERATAAIEASAGRGHYFDLHTHGRPDRWFELGYGLSPEELSLDDELLDRPWLVARSTVRALVTGEQARLAEVIRGETSLGGLLESRGYFALPSPARPHALHPDYFAGGYSIDRHGSRRGGTVDATQVEVPYDFVQPELRRRHADRLAQAILDFMQAHYGFNLRRIELPHEICAHLLQVPAGFFHEERVIAAPAEASTSCSAAGLAQILLPFSIW